MNLKKINEYIGLYKKFLQQRDSGRELFMWESQQFFANNWDIDAPDFGKMYDVSLQNSETRRLWTGTNFAPKQRMLEYIKLNPEFVRNMFRELFNEEKAVENRISKFQFGCDSMLQDFKEINRTTIENNHDHLDNHVISMYLAFRFPAHYPIIFYPPFKSLMQKLGSTKVPTPFETERCFKICRTLQGFLEKDEELIALHQQQLQDQRYYSNSSLLLVTDFYRFIGYQSV